MPLVRFLKRQPDGGFTALEVVAEAGQSLMQAALRAGIDGVAADCGGTLSCATCHVYVVPEWAQRLPPAQADELDMLAFTAAERRPGSRLSCQIGLSAQTEGLSVELPDRQH